jgi:mannose-6-phosphate isomerase-like protein (cupin superfamily)
MAMIDKQSAEHYVWGEGCDGWRLVQRPELSVIHERMPPGTAEVRHYHVQARQFFFIISGRAAFELEGQTEQISIQQGIEVPPMVPHRIATLGDEPLEFLVISQPTSRGDRVIVAQLPDGAAEDRPA